MKLARGLTLAGFAFWTWFYAIGGAGFTYDELLPVIFAIPVLLGLISIVLVLAELGRWQGARLQSALVLTFAGLLLVSPVVADDGREVACLYGLWPDPSVCRMMHPLRDPIYTFFLQHGAATPAT
jgi:hypothetical protein